MPRKNTNARPHRSTRALLAVPDPTPAPAGRTVAEDKLWAALHAYPATTSSDLAAHAGIGRSTAGKILAAWAGDGSVIRTSGPGQGGRRGADLWTITDTTPDQNTEPPVDQQPDVQVADEPVHGTAPDTIDGETAGPTDQDGAGQQPAGSDTLPCTGAAASGDAGSPPARGPRLGKGALRGMVEDYLAEHPSEQFSPSAIGKALNRSSGAVNNALDKLVADGYAVQTQERPKRFAIKATAPESAAQ